jgi:hypothetical protein
MAVLDPELMAGTRERSPIAVQQVRVTRLLDEMDDESGPVPESVAAHVAGQWRERDRRSAG